MRVIGGKLKSRKLKTLKGDQTRPTADKIKGAIFSSIAFDTNYNAMLDLFAGSGAMGIEALSRGFKYVHFNDLSRDAIKIIKANLSDLNLTSLSKVSNLDYKKCLKSLSEKKQFDFIFIDPPYGMVDIGEIFADINKYDSVSKSGLVVVEVSSQTDLKDHYYDLYKYKEKKYGSTRVFYYKKEGRK